MAREYKSLDPAELEKESVNKLLDAATYLALFCLNNNSDCIETNIAYGKYTLGTKFEIVNILNNSEEQK